MPATFTASCSAGVLENGAGCPSHNRYPTGFDRVFKIGYVHYKIIRAITYISGIPVVKP